ncbi:hypothetical protein [Hydrocoleum sp. CS-953]|uniref:hypothetical protein n=1 Tax=Hydrocoleum sp. CS-953 TaxID=1671698 RepID=UPI001179A74F|nr:hypothetical protein [Hydrocoleum sp. CS-953]
MKSEKLKIKSHKTSLYRNSHTGQVQSSTVEVNREQKNIFVLMTPRNRIYPNIAFLSKREV